MSSALLADGKRQLVHAQLVEGEELAVLLIINSVSRICIHPCDVAGEENGSNNGQDSAKQGCAGC